MNLNDVCLSLNHSLVGESWLMSRILVLWLIMSNEVMNIRLE